MISTSDGSLPEEQAKAFAKQYAKEIQAEKDEQIRKIVAAKSNKELDTKSATIDHILPKFKGGHNVKSNMICSCSKCNRLKGSHLLEDWYNPTYKFYQEERLDKIRQWMDQDSSIKILSPDKATPYITNDFYIGWVAS